MMHEQWKPIVGWAGYEVSNGARVRSLKTGKPRVMTPVLRGANRSVETVVLRNGPTQACRSIQKLMRAAFPVKAPPPPIR